MASRVIKATVTSGSNNEKKHGEYIIFGSINSDTGPVDKSHPVAGTLDLSSLRVFGTLGDVKVDIVFVDADGESTATVARSAALTYNTESHADSVALESFTTALITAETPASIWLVVYYPEGTGNGLNIRNGCVLTLTVDYEVDATCTTPPTSVSVSASNVAPSAAATLSWSGAASGTNNAITGYEVYRATSSAGSYELLETLTSSNTSGSLTVTAPAVNGAAYYYKVRTLGTEEGYDSELSSAYATLTCTYSAPSAPTRVLLDGVTRVYARAGDTVRLEWHGATAGANNPITGYLVQRNTEVYSSRLPASKWYLDVPAPNAGYYSDYRVVTLGTYSNSAPSVARRVYSYSDPGAPSLVTASKTSAAANARVKLSWSGAAAGDFNEITGYKVYRATAADAEFLLLDTVASSADEGSCYVTAPSSVGLTYFYRVETVGERSSSGQSSAAASVSVSGEAEDDSNQTTVEITPKPKRSARRFIFGGYDTAADGLWTLGEWSFPEPPLQTNFVDVQGRDGPLDMSTALTNGDPRYGGRSLTVGLESSEGSRLERKERIRDMAHLLHGQRVRIVFPDDPDHYAEGRVSVRTNYNDPAHAAVTISATCDPWLFSRLEKSVTISADTERVTVLHNAGRRVLLPLVIVSGSDAEVTLSANGHTWTLSEGEYYLTDLLLQPGNTLLTYEGKGVITFRYREAVL